jgi:hypothetical protein
LLEELLRSLIDYFKCGNYVAYQKKYQNQDPKSWGCYRCTKFSDNYSIIIEFFKQYPIRGTKAKDFLDWTKAAEIIKNGGHLTNEGAVIIQKIKAGMNTKRLE